jgi:hypothetical protein
MTNLLEQTISSDDPDQAAEIIQQALGIESEVANYCFPQTWPADREQRARIIGEWLKTQAPFSCHRVAEQRHQSVAELLGDFAAHFRDRRRGHVEIGGNHVAPFLGIAPCHNAGRIHQIAKHDCEIAALAGGVRRRSGSNWRSRHLCGSWRFRGAAVLRQYAGRRWHRATNGHVRQY